MIEERTKTIGIGPIEVEGRSYTELQLVAPRVGWRLEAERKHLRQSSSAEATTNYSVALTSKCASVSAKVLAELEDDVFGAAWEWINSFSDKPADGEPSAEPVEDEGEPLREKTIDLPSPVTVDGRDYHQLILHPPKVGWRRQAEGHLRQTQRPDDYTRYGVALIAKCAEVDTLVIHAVDDDVFFEAWEWISGFLAGGRRTGSSSPPSSR